MDTDRSELHDKAYALATNSESAEPAVTADAAKTSQPEDSGSGYFLEVDERHRYRTPEDVKRAIGEADRRIAELSPLEERLKYHGIESPEHFDAVVDEYLTRLEERQQAEGAAALTEEDRAALAYLQKLGFLTRGDVGAADREQHTQEARAQEGQTVELGRDNLRSLVAGAGLPATAAKLAEPWLAEFIQGQSVDAHGHIKRGSLLDRFWDGGESAKKVVQEAFAAWKVGVDELRGTARQPTQTSSHPNKTISTRGGQPMREGNPCAGTPSSMHNAAWELMNRTPRRRRGIR